jgi:mannose-6-phosphate isomerase-like protein (cupin superfamily)
VEGRSWRLIPLSEIASDEDLKLDDARIEAARREHERGGHPTFPGYPRPHAKWHAIRNHFGITAFGVAATEAAQGEALIWPHTEKHYGHEELYLVLTGRARFLFENDGEAEVGAHEVLYVRPEVGRGAIALETPTVVFMVGGKPGAYEIPVWANDWRPPNEGSDPEGV